MARVIECMDYEVDEMKSRIAELEALLKRAEPALWILATSGNAEAVQLHADCRDAMSR